MAHRVTIAAALALTVVALLLAPPAHTPAEEAEEADRHVHAQVAHRSPVDLVLAASGEWLVTANETNDSISLVETKNGKVLDELRVGAKPAYVERCLDDQHVLVSCTDGGQVVVVEVVDGRRLAARRTIDVGYHPVGLAVTSSGERAYVGLTATGEVAELDLKTGAVERRFEVGPWPRYLTLSPDDKRLAVGCSGESRIAVVDVEQGEVLYKELLSGGINIGHLQASRDGKQAYFPWMVYRSNPISPGNIRLGWVLASRIARVRLDGETYREAISLDVPRKAVADPHGLVVSSDERRLVVSASGTHELLVYRLPDLPFVGVGGPGDLIDRRLLADKDLFYRIDVGGRPMGMEFADDDRTVYVANYVNDCVQVVDIESRQVIREFPLGVAPEPSLARRGMAIFYDGQRSLDQWYSCHSCHYNGGVNSKSMDTWNDGTRLTMKTVLPLYEVTKTRPWTWHGWQDDFQDALNKSFTTTMQGQPIRADEAEALTAYLDTLKPPSNPFREPDGSLTAAAARGKAVFHSSKAGCANCHSGPRFTDGEIHDVGLGSPEDRYDGFNTPTLIGVHRKIRLLHDGRVKSLEDLLTGPHSPEKVTGEGKLTDQERADLIEYLRSL